MNTRSVARIAWLIPALLAALTLHQTFTAFQLNRTLEEGTPAWAEVTRYDRSDRKDVTNVSLDLLVHLSDGSTFERKNLALPYSIGHRVESDTLQVTVLPGSGQEVVISEIGKTQVRIAGSNAAMSFIALIMAFVGVMAWNRLLKKTSAP